jgi:hypothetical protein
MRMQSVWIRQTPRAGILCEKGENHLDLLIVECTSCVEVFDYQPFLGLTFVGVEKEVAC